MTAREIGDRLRALRNTRTIAQVAEETGLKVSAISNYEQGLRVPRDNAKCVLAKYYGVDIGSLFFDENYTKRVDNAT